MTRIESFLFHYYLATVSLIVPNIIIFLKPKMQEENNTVFPVWKFYCPIRTLFSEHKPFFWESVPQKMIEIADAENSRTRLASNFWFQ